MPFDQKLYTKALHRIFESIHDLQAMHGSRRTFTIDGRLVGDIGEIVAEHFYELELDTMSRHTHDATAVINGITRNISIKATFKRSLTFRRVPDMVLGLALEEDGRFTEIYNGPGRLIADYFGHRKHIGEKLLSFSNATLLRLSEGVPNNQKIQRKTVASSEPVNGVLEIPQPLGLFAGDLWARSQQYFSAFKALMEEDLQRFAFPRSYSLFHAYELLLKAFLAAKDAPKVKIMQYQHHLERLWNRCVRLGAPGLSFDFIAFCRRLDEMNREQDLRYPTNYRIAMPHPDYCSDVYEGLDAVLGRFIHPARTDAELHFNAAYRGMTVRWSD